MKYRKFGKSSALVSEIGLGTSQLAKKDQPREAQRMIESALEMGVNFFDTADQYGNSEEWLGQLPSHKKEKAFFATKAGYLPDGSRSFEPAYLRKQVEQSLRRLKVEALDLFQINKPSAQALKQWELLPFLAELKREGKIRLAGIVVGELEAGEQAVRSGVVDGISVLHHLLYQDTKSLMREAAAQGLGVLVRSPFSSGLLVGNITSDSFFRSSPERSRVFTQEVLAERLGLLQEIRAKVRIEEDEVISLALRFILAQPEVSTVIPGPSTQDQLRKIREISSQESLALEKVQSISSLVASKRSTLRFPFQHV